jgi:hypothetical protein
MCNIFRLFLIIIAMVPAACFGPFVGERMGPERPLVLQVRFDSATATAQLSWSRSTGRGFTRYAILRAAGSGLVPIGETTSIDDTVFVDTGLRADREYSYQIVRHYHGTEENLLSQASTPVGGGIHRFVGIWSLPVEPQAFRPTRLVVSRRGVVSVVGIGAGYIARFDRAGNPLPSVAFTSSRLAAVETGTLDGPALATDSMDNLYVVFNVQEDGSAPLAHWSKFDQDGQLLWTQPLASLFARHIAVDREDNPFIESISQLQQFDPAGKLLSQYAIPPLLVSSLRFWKDNFAALVEPVQLTQGGWQAPRLVVYKEVERSTSAVTIGRDPLSADDSGSGLLQRPTDFVVDEASNRAFVVNAGAGRVEVFRAGKFLTRWGAEGDGPGQFRFAGTATVLEDLKTGTLENRSVTAGGIARDLAGFIYVADTFNNRIQKFQP